MPAKKIAAKKTTATAKPVVRATPASSRKTAIARVTKPAAKLATAATTKKPAKSAAPARKPAVKAAPVANAANAAKPAKLVKMSEAAAAADTKAKAKKAKLVRDSFTMPEAEYALLGEVKKACLSAGFAVKKSELLRIGVALVRSLDTAALKQRVGSLAPLKAGRPKKDKPA